ncbi:acyltransferase [Planctomycetota bacterium]
MDNPEMKSDVIEGVLIHESSYVDKNAKIGKGTKIWHFCNVMKDVEIGENCNIGQNVVIMPGVKVGSNCKIQNNVSLYTGVTCEDDVFLGPSCVLTNVFNPRSHVSRKDEYRDTLIKKGSSIGANATIVCGHTVGRYAFVGSGAVVTRDVPDHALVYGSPAKVKGWMCECGVKIEFDTFDKKGTCEACGKSFKLSGNSVELL